MPQPTPYTRITDFSSEESAAVSGRSTVRTAALDAELDAAQVNLRGLNENLALIQRDDGDLRDGVVKLHTLGGDTRSLLAAGAGTPRGAWATATTYALRDLVSQGGETYICAQPHTSGVFASDLAANRWLLLSLSSAPTASAVPVVPGDGITAANVQAALEELHDLKASASELADTEQPTGGAGMVGFSPSPNYATGTVGNELKQINLLKVSGSDLANSALSNRGAGLVGYSDLAEYAAGTIGAKVRALRTAPKNSRIAMLGDSITRDGINNTATQTRNANRGLTHWVPFLTSQRFVSPQSLNFGVSGQTSEQIASRVGDVIASGAGMCIVLAGTNDIGSLTTAQTQANLASIYAALERNNIFILALPILPRTLAGEANYSFPQKVNEWIRDQASNYAGFKFIDPYEFGDQYSLTYSPRPDWTYDGLHPKAIGAFTIGWRIAEFLNTLAPWPGPAIRSVCDFFNATNRRGALNANPLMAGAGGTLGAGVTGTVADNYRLQRFATAGGDVSSLTVAASSNGAVVTNSRTGGVNQRIVVGGTATGGADTSVILDAPATMANINVGDVVELVADVEFPGATIGISGVEAYMIFTMNGVPVTVSDGYPILADDYLWRAVPEARFRTPPMLITHVPSATFIGIKIGLRNTAAATRSIDLRVNNIVVRKVVA
jgi:lysophospholipase L1-like esterase